MKKKAANHDYEAEAWSDVAKTIADDVSLDADQAIRQLLALHASILENIAVSLWDIREALNVNGTKH